ncbi:N-acyl homoserine lactonase family protein [Rhodococcus koreensis]|uniref:Metallo-beta-lactamase superfamily protein n=1 Tax=Rhodococcus koreensis TaxID=99653 RepID=A0A1H4X0L4_9NOCA|nr:N-acyl homoserine lactonase family protein [Rhodococcus koreensis]SEC98294.1 Metallo-beta-lactamase superfamily protein [Rhodococcus koreensis]
MASSGTIKHLWALDAPMLKVDKSIMILGAGGELVSLPSPSFLIEHAEHGLLIFDTGLAGAGDPASTYGPLAELFAIEFPAERALDRQLESLGFSTADVERVVISHLHFDHTGGLEHFAGAQGYIGSGELRYARTPDNHVKGFFRQEDLDAADRIDWCEVPAGYDHDVFGDGSVVVLSLPGHTPGSLGLKLRLPDGSTLVLSGDVAHIQDNISCCVGMPADSDTVGAIESLKKLKLLRSQPNTTVVVNHDIDDWNRLRANGRQVV